MELHNTAEDVVFAALDEICNTLEKKGNPDKICICDQCRIDAACYVLNRIEPHYIVSHRGVVRVEREGIKSQQDSADVVSLVFEALKRVNHNQRPFADHSQTKGNGSGVKSKHTPVFNIPTIIGRLFNGQNFSPMADVLVELRQESKLVEMKNQNWQNPFSLVSITEGAFTFWPDSIPAEDADIQKIFEYSVKVEVSGFETLQHYFKIPVISELQNAGTFSMERTFKLPDLYMFALGGGEEDQ
jgi:competence protein ComFB